MVTCDYKSCFGRHIQNLIDLKRKSGFVYDSEAYHLKKFDEFCTIEDEKGSGISRELMMKRGTLRETESRSYLSIRVNSVRQLCIYMNSIGIDSYVPRMFTHKSGYISHVLADNEISACFTNWILTCQKQKAMGATRE